MHHKILYLPDATILKLETPFSFYLNDLIIQVDAVYESLECAEAALKLRISINNTFISKYPVSHIPLIREHFEIIETDEKVNTRSLWNF